MASKPGQSLAEKLRERAAGLRPNLAPHLVRAAKMVKAREMRKQLEGLEERRRIAGL